MSRKHRCKYFGTFCQITLLATVIWKQEVISEIYVSEWRREFFSSKRGSTRFIVFAWNAFSFKNLSETVLLGKSLLSEYAASWPKQAFSNSFLYKCFKLPVSVDYWFLSRCLVNDPKALRVNTGCFKCNSGINLSPVNKNLLIILFILNFITANV